MTSGILINLKVFSSVLIFWGIFVLSEQKDYFFSDLISYSIVSNYMIYGKYSHVNDQGSDLGNTNNTNYDYLHTIKSIMVIFMILTNTLIQEIIF